MKEGEFEEKAASSFMNRPLGAQGETRTPMPLRALRPEHSVSTNFTTWAGRGKGI